ncbi:MAG: DUF1800 family protein [Sandaracinaceae bacterium]
MNVSTLRRATWLAAVLSLMACEGSRDGPDEGAVGPDRGLVSDLARATAEDDGFATEASTGRFLTQATFGPTEEDLEALTGRSASGWVLQQMEAPPTRLQPIMQDLLERGLIREGIVGTAFLAHAIAADDQLRQRVAFALSEILVVSDIPDEIADSMLGLAYYEDILIRNAFGNYRSLLEEVTYAPVMGTYLTYLGNRKGDPATGRQPDENYARELLQLFTIGTVELNADGTPRVGSDGAPIETYDNADISGLARVFTGLVEDGSVVTEELEEEEPHLAAMIVSATPMTVEEASHELGEKTFLGLTIPAGTGLRASIEMALDHIMAHPNIGPFVGGQLIQRLVTSNPSPAYVQRVSIAFDHGRFVLPDGRAVGTEVRGDLGATVAAILFDREARDAATAAQSDFGKVREPILRFTAWARAFRAEAVTPLYLPELWNLAPPDQLGQHPYRAPSVFNFFRPGYVAPATLSGAAGLVAPELQIVNATTVPSYANVMTFFVLGGASRFDREEAEEIAADFEGAIEPEDVLSSLVPDYGAELALADRPAALVDRLDRLLTSGAMSDDTRGLLTEIVEALPLDAESSLGEGADARVHLAVLLALTSPDFLVQR